jgi:hypothetical protein
LGAVGLADGVFEAFVYAVFQGGSCL